MNLESFINGNVVFFFWEYIFVFDKFGFYNYYCDFYCVIDMLGMVIVIFKLVIIEIMYNLFESGLDFLEFIEIFNNGLIDVNFKDYLLDGVSFIFLGFNLDVGFYVMVVVDFVVFENNFGCFVFQWIGGFLSNGGEILLLLDGDGMVVDLVDYDDGNGWFLEVDGFGVFLVFCDVNVDNSGFDNW